MKITLKFGKKDQTIKVKTIEDLGKVTHILYGQILKQDMMPEIAGEKFSCKLDGEKIDPKKLLVLLKDKLKEIVPTYNSPEFYNNKRALEEAAITIGGNNNGSIKK